jgi:cell division protein FtsQ
VQFRQSLAATGRQPTRVWLSARRAWRIELDRQLNVEVGREDATERVRRFAAAYPDSLARLELAVDYVDLRYPNGFAVRMPDYKPAESKLNNG